jgi:hypothetical protein
MRTIPDTVLDQLAEHRPDLAPLVIALRADSEQAAQLERELATAYLLGEIRLSAQETWYLSQVGHGGPWGGDWLSTAHAALLTGYDDSHLRRLAKAGKLSAVLRGKTWYVRREALAGLPKVQAHAGPGEGPG